MSKTATIGYDASFVHGQKNGTAVYSHNLLTHLSQIDHHNRYTVFPFFTYHYIKTFKNYQPRLTANFTFFLHTLPETLINTLWNRLSFCRQFLVPRFDLFHSTTMAIPPASYYRRLIVTILDTTFYSHPQYHQKANVDHCMTATNLALKRADLIMTISHHTKNDLVKYFNFPPDKIVVSHLSCDEFFFIPVPNPQKQTTLNKYHLAKPFIFHLGSIEPRKNTLGLIKAYLLLPPEVQEKYDLVIGGAAGWLNTEIFTFIKNHNTQNRIKFIGYVPDTDLAALYQTAEIMAYPSFYEGFGVPILEAMASGCPVLTSNISSMPEIGGEAATYCDPYDIEDIASKIQVLLNKKDTALIKTSINQAKKFSWTRCAQETLEAYRRLL